MRYEKPALTLDAQVEQLIRRGMIGDPEKMQRRLGVVSYYRLSGYWFHRKTTDDTFKPGTTFEVAWKQYIFDRKLRLLLMDAIERIEVALRTQFAYHHSHAHGAFGYSTDATSLPGLSPIKRVEQLKRVHEEVKRSRELFASHFRDKYGDSHDYPPLWIATETLSFGCVLGLWQASTSDVKNKIAAIFGVSDQVLRTWFWTLNEVRNVCAHHGRLWNRVLGNKPKIPYAKHHPAWHQPSPVSNDRVYSAFSIAAHSLTRIAPHSSWHRRVRTLVEGASAVAPLANMGFPPDWLQSALWIGAQDATI